MSKAQRDKGAGFENEIAADLRAAWGVPVKRNLGQARDSGCDLTVPPFFIECKRRALIGVYAWLDQVMACCGARVPIVVARADRREAIVIMRYADWTKIAAGELERS